MLGRVRDVFLPSNKNIYLHSGFSGRSSRKMPTNWIKKMGGLFTHRSPNYPTVHDLSHALSHPPTHLPTRPRTFPPAHDLSHALTHPLTNFWKLKVQSFFPLLFLSVVWRALQQREGDSFRAMKQKLCSDGLLLPLLIDPYSRHTHLHCGVSLKLLI